MTTGKTFNMSSLINSRQLLDCKSGPKTLTSDYLERTPFFIAG